MPVAAGAVPALSLKALIGSTWTELHQLPVTLPAGTPPAATRIRKCTAQSANRAHGLDKFTAGDMTVILDNRDRALEPGPGGSLGLDLGQHIVLQATLTGLDYGAVLHADHPIGYWRYADLTDASGNGWALTLVSTAAVAAAGPFGSALSTGATGYATTAIAGYGYTGPAASLGLNVVGVGQPQLSFETWLKLNAVGGTYGIAYCGAFKVTTTAATLTVTLVGSFGTVAGTFNYATALTAGTWHHIAFSYDGYQILAYADGAQIGAAVVASVAVLSFAANSLLDLGYDGTNYLGGYLAETAVEAYPLDPGEVANRYSLYTSQTVTQTLWRGLIDGLDPVWVGISDAALRLTAQDANKPLNLLKINDTGYAKVILARNPVAYWRLGDPPGSPFAADLSGNSYPLVPKGSGFAFGVAGASIADADTAADFGTASTSWLQSSSPQVPAAAAGQSAVWSFEAWVYIRSLLGSDVFYQATWPTTPTGSVPHVQIVPLQDGSLWQLSVTIWDASNNDIAVYTTSGFSLNAWHHIAVVHNGGTSITLYVDGISRAVTVQSAQAVTMPTTSPVVQLGGAGGGLGPSGALNGIMDEVVLYTTALTAGQVFADYSRYLGAWASQDAGARVHAVLDARSWPTALRAVDGGLFLLQAETNQLFDTSDLAYLQKVVDSEDGRLVVDGSGRVTFHHRLHYTAGEYRTVYGPFGDSPPAELPMQTGGIQPVYNDDELYNDQALQRMGGVIRLGQDQNSMSKYGMRSIPRVTDLMNSTDADVTTIAYSIVARSAWPVIRIPQLVVDPRATPALWAHVLLRHIGDLTQVNRRPPGGGSPLQIVSRIQGVTHDIDPQARTWTWTADLGDPTDHWFSLDDPTWGLLDSTADMMA